MKKSLVISMAIAATMSGCANTTQANTSNAGDFECVQSAYDNGICERMAQNVCKNGEYEIKEMKADGIVDSFLQDVVNSTKEVIVCKKQEEKPIKRLEIF